MVNDTQAKFTFTPSGTCKALILYNIANSGATEDINGKKAIRVGTTDYSQAEKSANYADMPDSIFTVWVMSLSASSTTVQGMFASNHAATVTINRRQLGILMFADDTLLDTVSSDTQVSTTQTSLQYDGQATISHTTSDTRELLVVAMGTKRHGTIDSNYGECYGIMVDDIDRANSRGSCSYDPTAGEGAGSAATAYAVNTAAGSHTIKGRFSNNYAGQTARIDSRRIVALWLSTVPGSQPTTNFAFVDGGSVAILASETPIKTLSTSFSLGADVAVIASEQFDNTGTSTRTISAGNDKLQQNDQATGQTTNEYIMRIPVNNGNDDGKGFGLLNTYTNVPASPEYEVKATASATSVNGESKILALSKPPKVPEFPLGPALVMVVCFPILFAVRRWKRTG